MSLVTRLGFVINHKCILFGITIAFSLGFAPSSQADPMLYSAPIKVPVDLDPNDEVPASRNMQELRAHAETINDILENARERVDQLAEGDASKPELVAAIRQELALSRRWNSHLATILVDVAEARRELGERERLAAKEIAHITAVAEEARLELLTLKKVLSPPPAEVERGLEDRSDAVQDGKADGDASRQTASIQEVADMSSGAVGATHDDLDSVRAALDAMQEAQSAVEHDVGAVRGKLIDALQTLANIHGDLPLESRSADLSSQDITAWAASMAIRLNRDLNVDDE